MYRKIFMVEAFNDCGDLLIRKFAANKKTAKRIAKPHSGAAVVRELQKCEWNWIDMNSVKRL